MSKFLLLSFLSIILLCCKRESLKPATPPAPNSHTNAIPSKVEIYLTQDSGPDSLMYTYFTNDPFPNFHNFFITSLDTTLQIDSLTSRRHFILINDTTDPFAAENPLMFYDNNRLAGIFTYVCNDGGGPTKGLNFQLAYDSSDRLSAYTLSSYSYCYNNGFNMAYHYQNNSYDGDILVEQLDGLTWSNDTLEFYKDLPTISNIPAINVLYNHPYNFSRFMPFMNHVELPCLNTLFAPISDAKFSLLKSIRSTVSDCCGTPFSFTANYSYAFNSNNDITLVTIDYTYTGNVTLDHPRKMTYKFYY